MGNLNPVDQGTFDAEVLRADGPVLVDFWATWCGPCKQLAPVLDEVAAQTAGKLKIVTVDIDANPALAQQYGVMSVPTLAVFQGGAQQKTLVGAKSKTALLNDLAGYLH